MILIIVARVFKLFSFIIVAFANDVDGLSQYKDKQEQAGKSQLPPPKGRCILLVFYPSHFYIKKYIFLIEKFFVFNVS